VLNALLEPEQLDLRKITHAASPAAVPSTFVGGRCIVLAADGVSPRTLKSVDPQNSGGVRIMS
jgi:hypothetical protein